MSKDAQKLAADVEAARVKINEARAAERVKVNQAKAAAREAEAALVNAIADDVHTLYTQGGTWSEIVARFGCSRSVYYSARKVGAQRAAIAAVTARKAAADAEAERKAADVAANEAKADAERKAAAEAEARAVAEAEAARKAAEDACCPSVESKALELCKRGIPWHVACKRLGISKTAYYDALMRAKVHGTDRTMEDVYSDIREEMTPTLVALAEIIEHSLNGAGIKTIGAIQKHISMKSARRSNGVASAQFCITFRTDWRTDGDTAGFIAKMDNRGAEPAPVDEISKLRAGCDGLRAVLAMAQMQLDSMIAAKSGKP